MRVSWINAFFSLFKKFASRNLHKHAIGHNSLCDNKHCLFRCFEVRRNFIIACSCCKYTIPSSPVANIRFQLNSQKKLLKSIQFLLKVTFANKMLGFFAWVMPLFVACSTFGSLNGAIFASSRLFFVGARNGHLPAAISLININCLTPIPSLIFMCILTLALLFIRDVYMLINYVSYVEALFTLFSISGLLWLRRTQPNAKRPIKVNIIVPLIYLLTCSFLVVSSCNQSPTEVGVATLVILSGIPIYYITIHHPIPLLSRLSQNINRFCQKLFLCVPNQEKFE